MKNIKLLLSIALIFIVFKTQAQNIINNGANINISTGTVVKTSNGGNFINNTEGNDGTVDIDGILSIDGDFINNATGGNVFVNAGTNGEVIFASSGVQQITGTGNYINFEKLTINNSSSTEITAGYAITTNGVFTVNGDFTLKSPLNYGRTASLITGTSASDITGSGTLNIERFYSVNGKWQEISIPMANQNTSLLTDDPNPGYTNPNFYTYNEAYDGTDPVNTNYDSWYNLGNAWTSVTPGTINNNAVGYSFYHTENDVFVTFSSTPTNLNYSSSYSPTVTYNYNDGGIIGNDYFDGWNMIGNPYPCALDWESFTLTNIDNTVYLWDSDLGSVNGGTYPGNYIYYNSGTTHDEYGDITINKDVSARYIPAMQGFVVKASGNSPSVTIPAAARLHSSNAMFKNILPEEKNFEYLKLRTEINDLYDETAVRFIENSNSDFDKEFDAYKMFPNNPDIPMLYSITENSDIPLAINSLPYTATGTKVPLGFKTGESGTYTINVKEFNFDENTKVILVDNDFGIETLLSKDVSYSFYFNGNENRNRLYLWFAPVALENNNLTDNETIKIWADKNIINISLGNTKLPEAQTIIYNSLGQQIINKKIYSSQNKIKLMSTSGIYIVKLITNENKIITQKVYISQ